MGFYITFDLNLQVISTSLITCKCVINPRDKITMNDTFENDRLITFLLTKRQIKVSGMIDTNWRSSSDNIYHIYWYSPLD